MSFYGRPQQLSMLHRLFERRITNVSDFRPQTREQNNAESLAVLLGEAFHFPTPAFTSLETVLEYLFRRGENEEFILVLDEYPYLRETVVGMDSILQSLIDRFRDSSRMIDPMRSVKENIIELIASPGARLENEVPMYMKSEISRIGNANEVFETLAKGFSRYSDILSQSHVSSAPTLADVLEKLIRYGKRTENSIS